MAEPATLPGDEPNTIRSGGHEGKVAVQNPLTGDIALVEPDDAAHRGYSMGWQPVSSADATRIISSAVVGSAAAVARYAVSPMKRAGPRSP